MTTQKKQSEMSKEELRAYKRAWYNKNKQKVQLQRLTKGLMNDNRKVKPETLEKYNIPIEDGKAILPVKAKLVFTKSNSIMPIETIDVGMKQVPSKLEAYEDDNTAFNGRELKKWVKDVLVKMPKKMGNDDVRGVAEIRQYFNVPDLLFKLYEKPYDEEMDLTDMIIKTSELIKVLDKTKLSASSKAKHLGRILFLSRNFPPMKKSLPKSTYETLNNQWTAWNGNAKASQRLKSQTTAYFAYDIIKEEVQKQYGTVSYQNLLIQMYDEVIGRDDFQLHMAFQSGKMEDTSKNYLLLKHDKKNPVSSVHMNSYKTAGSFGKSIFKLSPGLAKLIQQIHPDNTSTVLFRMEKGMKLSNYIMNMLKAIPLFKNEPGLGVKYLRHSIISTKLMKLDKNSPDYSMNVVEIARQAMHSTEIQSAYISPLKNEKGQLVLTPDDIKETTNTLEEVTTGHPLIGTKIRKKFGKLYYNGEVIAFNGIFFKAIYTDGDLEEYKEHEIKRLSKNYKNMKM